MAAIVNSSALSQVSSTQLWCSYSYH